MRYLIIFTNPETGDRTAVYTDWYDYENNYNEKYKMIVIDRAKSMISFDGEIWQRIEDDHL
jgi:hypothetical protein